MSILVINRDKGVLYSNILPEVKSELVVLSWHILPDSNKFQYFEHIPDLKMLNYYLEIKALELHKEYGFTAIIAENEYDLIRAGRLRDLLQIEGQTEASAIAFRDKVIMKNYLQGKVNLPNYRRLTSGSDLYSFIEEHGFPVVVKPTDGSAARGVVILHDYKELLEFSKTTSKEDLMVETFVKGEMYHVDAFVEEGTVVFLSASRYINQCLNFFRENVVLGSYQFHPVEPMYKRLKAFFQEVLAMLPAPKIGVYHLEVFRTEGDQLIFCEVASRIGGGNIYDYFKHGYDIELDTLLYRKWSGLPVKIETDNPDKVSGFLLFPPKKGVLLKQPEKVPFEWVIKYDKYGEIGREYNNPEYFSDRVAGMLVEGATSKEVLQRLQLVLDWYEKELKWRFPEVGNS